VPGPLLITCTGGAEGKCIRFGYKPWHPLSDGTSLEPYYRACVRLVRADYGGDGVGHTRNGTPIDLFDPDWHFSVTKPPLCASRGEAQKPSTLQLLPAPSGATKLEKCRAGGGGGLGGCRGQT
jgi:hypothetical protein